MHPGCGTRATDDWARGQGDPTGRFGKGDSRAGAVPHDGDGDGRRRAASQGVGPCAFDAGLAGAPQNGGDANLWSPEATSASMARGGASPEPRGRKRRPRRRTTAREREREEGTARKLTPETTEVTARHGEDRRRRNRGRGHAVVRAVKRQRRRGDGIPARVARRGRRGGPGAPFCHGDSSTEARSDGNVAATASSDAVGIRVRVCGRHRASERGKMRGEERGGPWGPYPRARRLGVDGIGVGRGWSDRLGRYRARGGRRPGNFPRTPCQFFSFFFQVLFPFYFSVLSQMLQ